MPRRAGTGPARNRSAYPPVKAPVLAVPHPELLDTVVTIIEELLQAGGHVDARRQVYPHRAVTLHVREKNTPAPTPLAPAAPAPTPEPGN